MLPGVLHTHSTYSDGEFTLAELRSLFAAAGCRFLCVTDHRDAFDAAKRDAYVAECAERSDAWFRFVPGLEYSCANRMHVLGYGVTELIDSTDPQEVIAGIHAAGGVPVIAHPKDTAFADIERFTVLPDGIEAWNTKYDGRYAPRPATFALIERLRAREPKIHAFYGQDLHWRTQYRGMLTRVDADQLAREAILNALRDGRFVGVKDGMELPATGVLPASIVAGFGAAHGRSDRLRQAMRRAKSWADRAGLTVPTALKAQLRRLF